MSGVGARARVYMPMCVGVSRMCACVRANVWVSKDMQDVCVCVCVCVNVCVGVCVGVGVWGANRALGQFVPHADMLCSR